MCLIHGILGCSYGLRIEVDGVCWGDMGRFLLLREKLFVVAHCELIGMMMMHCWPWMSCTTNYSDFRWSWVKLWWLHHCLRTGPMQIRRPGHLLRYHFETIKLLYDFSSLINKLVSRDRVTRVLLPLGVKSVRWHLGNVCLVLKHLSLLILLALL